MTNANNYVRAVDCINRSFLTPAERGPLERSARVLSEKGNRFAPGILRALAQSARRDKRVVFMSFCPGGVLRNRVDQDWKKWGNCTFEFDGGNGQLENYNSIVEGDLVVLKKIQRIGETMRLHGQGRVREITTLSNGGNILHMDWMQTNLYELEVPLLGCGRAVNFVETSRLVEGMPQAFWDWLRHQNPSDLSVIQDALTL